jgi:hypothetical protein
MLAVVPGPNLFIGVIIPLLAVGIPVCAVVDALSRPAMAFYVAGTHKTAWILVLVVATFLGLGLFLGAFYLISVRRKVSLVMGAAPGR